MELTLKKVHLSAGDHLTVKGVIPHQAIRFQIDIGSGCNDLALHFNPRFHDNQDYSVLVCNSFSQGCWGNEQREPNPLRRGEEVKIVVKLTGDMFKVELPGGHEVKFPNRKCTSNIHYVGLGGDFKLSSFKISQ